VIIELAPAPPALAQRATLAQGAPAEAVLGTLAAFLRAHPDEQVVVEWRVAQERRAQE
jgi:hypothetical protein